ncbi:MAG: hypothetical protein JOZ01_05555 [Candidatus Eremiobacteraeota bacterium]|nr:hypothetical protein [Candidatus Eremiobacteraeota bacterium]
MNARERNVWVLLAGGGAVAAFALTLWITHVDHAAVHVIGLSFDQRPVSRLDLARIDFLKLEREVRTLPAIALTSPQHVVLIPTAATQSIRLTGVDPGSFACASVDIANGGAAEVLANSGEVGKRTPIAIKKIDDGLLISIPSTMQMAIARSPDRLGAIECTASRPQYAKTTFTERAITLRAQPLPAGPIIVDVSALEDIDDLRFSGGLQLPLGGERTRLLFGNNNILTAEWTDVNASEERDIVLVIIGALSAIAAATVIEAIRPSVQARSKT